MKHVLDEEKLCQYWIGKSERVKNAVIYWLEHPKGTKGYKTQKQIAEEFGVSLGTIRQHLFELRKRGIISLAKYEMV